MIFTYSSGFLLSKIVHIMAAQNLKHLEEGLYNKLLDVSGKVPTYPSHDLTFCPKREGSVKVWGGVGGQFLRNIH